MAATEIRNGAVADREVQELNGRAARQVNAILEQASREKEEPKTFVAYRVPMAGVRYYF